MIDVCFIDERLCPAFLLSQQLNQNRFLHMQPIFRLIDNDRLRSVEHLGGNFFSAMGRQAMHDDGIGFGPLQQPPVQLIGRQTSAGDAPVPARVPC